MKSLEMHYWLDIIIFAGFLATLQPRFTGIAIHEWLSAAAAATLVLHVVLHWDWAMNITRTFFRNLLHVSRLNYVLDALLFVGFTVVMTSGLAISRVVMPSLGLQTFSSRIWLEIHNASANFTLLLVALHFALHWSWIKNTFNRLLVAPFTRRQRRPLPQARSLPLPVKDIRAL